MLTSFALEQDPEGGEGAIVIQDDTNLGRVTLQAGAVDRSGLYDFNGAMSPRQARALGKALIATADLVDERS
jgi:hypothetical protein